MTKLSQQQIEASHAWLYDVFAVAGVQVNHNVRSESYYDFCFYQPSFKANAEIIRDAIKLRKVDYKEFEKIDQALESMADQSFSPRLSDDESRLVRKPKEMLASYIANFCAEQKFYWDSRYATTDEMDVIKNYTLIGAALWEYGCFTTQPDETSKTRATTARTPGQPPQNNYKSLGALSENVSTLLSMPNQKLTGLAYDGYMYCIEGDKVGNNTPCIFVTPLSNTGNKISEQKAERVKLGSARGYAGCKLWFSYKSDAEQFLDDYNNSGANTKAISLHLAKQKEDQNGYFLVRTTLGNAYIKASKLNEEITAQLDESTTDNKKKTVKTSDAYSINDIDVYNEAFNKYRD